MSKKSGIVQEFKEFIMRGNVLDMAVGIIMGSAFTKIINSLVNDVLMPFIGIIIGGINFDDLKYIITAETADAAESAIYYGKFIQSAVDFVLMALVVFAMVKAINRLRRKKVEAPEEPAAPPAPPEDIALLTEIRDLLRRD